MNSHVVYFYEEGVFWIENVTSFVKAGRDGHRHCRCRASCRLDNETSGGQRDWLSCPKRRELRDTGRLDDSILQPIRATSRTFVPVILR